MHADHEARGGTWDAGPNAGHPLSDHKVDMRAYHEAGDRLLAARADLHPAAAEGRSESAGAAFDTAYHRYQAVGREALGVEHVAWPEWSLPAAAADNADGQAR